MGVPSMLSAGLLAASPVAQAQPAAWRTSPAGEPERTSFSTVPERKLAVYAEVTSVVVASSAGVSIAYRPWRGLAFSGGVGAGYFAQTTSELGRDIWIVASGAGGHVLVHALFGGTRDSFELAGGVSAIGDPNDDDEVWLLPALFVGYRRQSIRREESRGVFRVGWGWSYGYGLGLDLSFGATL